MTIITDLWNKLKHHLIYILIICILAVSLATSINRCSSVSGEYENNIAALNDTIKYYQDKNGNLVATKLAFESDLKTLKLLNADLYEQINDLKAKKPVEQAVYFGGEINIPEQDTLYIVEHDTIAKGFSKTFEFNNEFRTLEGLVDYHNDSLGVAIKKDQVKFDYTVALDKDNNIYVRSTNPYVTFNEISGFTVPKRKRPKTTFVIGPSAGYSYNINAKEFGWSIGLQATWGLNLGK